MSSGVVAGASVGAPWRAALLLVALIVAVAARTALNGPGVPSAFTAGALFGLVLVAVALRSGLRMQWPGWRSIVVGLAGGMILVILPAVARSTPVTEIGVHPQPFVAWVAVTALVAVGEEAVLRGALFEALESSGGVAAAIGITSLAFALIHVPLYGWHVVPLDLAVGVFLAGLRLLTRGIAAPALAHAIADLATWWM